MSKWISVLTTDALSDGAMKAVNAEGQEILIGRVGDTYYAADKRCPHRGGNLSSGTISGTIVTCPLHGSQFDLRDGHVVRWTNLSGPVATMAKALKPPRPLKTYPIKSENNQILVEI